MRLGAPIPMTDKLCGWSPSSVDDCSPSSLSPAVTSAPARHMLITFYAPSVCAVPRALGTGLLRDMSPSWITFNSM